MLFEFKKAFECAEPFIYRIHNDLYYIGVSICRKCNKDEKQLYQNFCNKYDELKVLQYPLKNDIKQLVELYDKIATPSESINYDKYIDKLKELAHRLTDEEIKDTINQKNIVFDVYKYKNTL